MGREASNLRVRSPGGSRGRLDQGQTTMKQRLRDDKKHGVFGATLSNVMWEGVVDSRSCESSDSFWALDQLSSVENGLCGK